MTKTLEKAIEEVRRLSDSEQDAAAAALMDFLESRRGGSALTDEQLAEVERRLAKPGRRRLTLEEVRAGLRRLGA